MSEETQNFTQALGDKFNKMMDDPTLFSVEKTEEQKDEDLKQKLITSVVNARTNISQSMKNFREYYIQTYGIEKWVEFNKNPDAFGTSQYLITGIKPNAQKNEAIPSDLGFLSPSASETEFRTSPSFYKKIYDAYLKNTITSAKYYNEISKKSSDGYSNSLSDELYKLFNVDLETQIKNRVNTSNVNERKAYYETQETDILYKAITNIQTFYIRILLLLCFIILYVFFLTQEINIMSIIKQFLYLLALIAIPYIISFIIRVLIITPQKLYEYLPANTWISHMSTPPV